MAVLASGSGTLLEAMLDAELPIDLVVTDRTCRALEIAESHGVPAVLVERTSYRKDFDRDGYTKGLVEVLEERRIDLVVMAGFGTVLGPQAFDVYRGRVLNTHPALLPSFKGWHAVRDALAYGVKVTGCTVHVATPEVDHGPILAQEAVAVLPDDTEASLHERIKQVERRLYIQTISDILQRGFVL
jgi:phosphoribosylglycinamide formyltransferase-1